MGYRRFNQAQSGSLARLSRRQLMFAGASAIPALMISREAVGHDSFPVTIEHAFGSTTIAHEPQRIVTLGWSGEDAVIALGKIPIAMTGYPYWPDGIADWNKNRMGSENPVLLRHAIDYEQIALLRPDLILAVFSGLDAIAYKRLSRIAPVVSWMKGPWSSNWQEQTQVTGRALGRTTESSKVIRSVENLVGDFKNTFSEIRGKTFALISHFPQQNGCDVYLPGDTRFEMFRTLGLRPSPGIARIGNAKGGFYSQSISLEQLDILDCDILIAWFAEGIEAACKSQPILNTILSIQRGTCVSLEKPETIWAVLTPTVLSIPFGYPEIVRDISRAATRLAALTEGR
jgi:iron complex transport system substrate-binding protein